MNGQKRMIAINDISCFGKCSLSVAIPILSAAGVETCAIPTAMLSSHTGFSGYTFLDLTGEMMSVADHWKTLGLSFDGIYTGYLGSVKQISCVETIIDMFPAEFVLIDPVMGDNGKLYDGFDVSYAKEMRRLLKRADVIVPNMTEGAFLSGMPYESGIHSVDYVQTIAESLATECSGSVVLTGVNTPSGCVGTAVWDNENFSLIEHEKIDALYSGTGDVFASVVAAAVVHGNNIENAVRIATDFVVHCILKTKQTSGDRSYGLDFELCIGKLLSGSGNHKIDKKEKPKQMLWLFCLV